VFPRAINDNDDAGEDNEDGDDEDDEEEPPMKKVRKTCLVTDEFQTCRVKGANLTAKKTKVAGTPPHKSAKKDRTDNPVLNTAAIVKKKMNRGEQQAKKAKNSSRNQEWSL
jgi:hypothetical protein